MREWQIQAAVIDHWRYLGGNADEIRAVSEFDGYFVTTCGRVFSAKTAFGKPKITELKFDLGHKGHKRVTLYGNGKKRRALVHRLVLETFEGAPPTDDHQALHRNDVSGDNRLSNLYWGTRSDNKRDSIRNGRSPVGSDLRVAKLTEADVVQIGQMVAENATTAEIQERFGLCESTVRRIIVGSTWKHVDRPTAAPKTKRIINEAKIAEAIASIADGASINTAAKAYGVSRQAINRRMKPPPIPEKKIHQAVIEHWKALGQPNTLVATLANERAGGQPGLTPGLPDLMVIGPQFVGFIELKREGGHLSRQQKSIIELMRRNGVPVEVTYGRDEPIRILEDWGIVRTAKRDTPNTKMLENPSATDHQLSSDDEQSGGDRCGKSRGRKRVAA